MQYNLSLQQVIGTIKANNANAGGSLLIRGEQAAVIRGIGLIRSPEDLGNVVVTPCSGAPVYLRIWADPRLAGAPAKGSPARTNADAVAGIVLMLRGRIPRRFSKGIHAKVGAQPQLLPRDVQIVPYLDRADLVQQHG